MKDSGNDVGGQSRLCLKSAAVCCPDSEKLGSMDLAVLPPDKFILPRQLRRRASMTTQMAVTAATVACSDAQANPEKIPAVFASVGGEIQVTDELCRDIPNPEQILSPTKFHNSVHNTTAGYWSILNQCHSPAVAIAALEDTFAVAVLEACSQLLQFGGELLLVCYDECWPQYLAPPMGAFGFCSALVLALDNDRDWPGISVPVQGKSEPYFDDRLEALIEKVPAAASLPLINSFKRRDGMQRVPLSSGRQHWYLDLEAG